MTVRGDLVTLGLSGCVLAFGLPKLVRAGILPDHAVGWPTQPDTETALLAALALFVLLFVIEAAAHTALALLLPPALATPRNLKVLARHTMGCIGLSYIGYLGVQMYRDLDPGFTPCSTSWFGAVSPPGCIPATARGRLYAYLPKFQWTAVAMLAFQCKNLLDTLIYGDGPEFVAHHVVCILVAVGVLQEGFLHLYGIFYFGLSEISTALISALAAFDADHGVLALGDHFPTAKLVVGLAFTGACAPRAASNGRALRPAPARCALPAAPEASGSRPSRAQSSRYAWSRGRTSRGCSPPTRAPCSTRAPRTLPPPSSPSWPCSSD